MNTIEDEIRDTLRSEAARLREVRPLSLPAAVIPREPQGGADAHRAWRLRAWLVPAAAAAAVVIVAAVLVAVKSLGNEDAAAPAASSSPVAGHVYPVDAVPRYYAQFGSAGNSKITAIVVDDAKTGKSIGAASLIPKGNYAYVTMSDTSVAGAANDTTFVASAAVHLWPASGRDKSEVDLPLAWYLVRVSPGAADPVRLTKLSIKFQASSPGDWEVRTTALSGDGTELAVLSSETDVPVGADVPVTLQVYSVATGRLQHSWPAGIDANAVTNPAPVSDLSWVGDSALGLAVTYVPEVREEVRTLNVSASGGSLLADSRVVWSQYVPPGKPTAAEKEVERAIGTAEPLTPHACDTPFLAGNGQAVVCGNSTYSPDGKRLSAVWLAYPLATPTRPRVLGGVQEPRNVSGFDGSVSVDWTNPSGTEVIGSWNPTVITGPSDNPVTTTANDAAYVEDGRVSTFPYLLGGYYQVAWLEECLVDKLAQLGADRMRA